MDVHEYAPDSESSSPEDSYEERVLLQQNPCDVGPNDIPKWIPLDFLYRLLSESGIGPIDSKHMPVIHNALKKVRQHSREVRETLAKTAQHRLRERGAHSNLILSDLMAEAPPGFDLNVEGDGTAQHGDVHQTNPTWNYNGVILERWKNANFIPGSAPDMTRRCSDFGSGEFIHVPSLFDTDDSTVVTRTILNKLAFPLFKSFRRDMTSISELVKRDLHNRAPSSEHVSSGAEAAEAQKEKDSRHASVYSEVPIEELLTANPDKFGASVCTVDGQQFHFGDSEDEFPLMSAIQPILYSLAMKDVGINEAQKWTGTEPTSISPASFSLMQSEGTPMDSEEQPNRKPFNPFMDSGALQTAALIGEQHLHKNKDAFHDSGSRFMHIIKHITELAGGRRIGYNNSVFLAQKEKRLQTLAVSHFMKGMGAYPTNTDPTDIANLLFQAQSVELNCEKLSVIAASFANLGVCPTTNEKILDNDELISLFSLMYNCGLNQYTGTWAFNVGIPASAGVSGACLIIIPNIMGIAIYSPLLNEWGIPPAALKFCENLTRRYRVNIFDQLVYRDEQLDVRSEEAEAKNEDFSNLSERQRSTLLFFELCTAANSGDESTVRQIIDVGIDVNQADYDLRTALHIAACENNYEIVRMLLEEGADILAKDRWGVTPYDEAVHRSYTDMVKLFEEEMVQKNLRKPKQSERDPLTHEISATAGRTDRRTSSTN
jgi:glutaminase